MSRPDLTDEQKLDAEVQRALARRKLDFYKPYPKQVLFHHAGGLPGIVERLLMAGNQVGKTLSAAAETAIHATGQYPDWWGSGYRYVHPIKAWVSGETSQSTRDNPQRLLLGEPGEWGTGMIPGRLIVDIKRAVHGVSDSVESVFVRHEPTGQVSRLQFKTYDQERKRWQGETLDFVWFDEEPPMDIYSEGKTRVQATNGFVFITFTPLLGMSDVVRRFLLEKPKGSVVVSMTIHDALHYTAEQRENIVANYPEHERSARSAGIPVLGSGAVFPIDEAQIKEVPIEIPPHWPRICGMDIGWDHPTAAVWIAWDRDTDTVHIYDAYRVKEKVPAIHAAAIKARGSWIPVAWPHDGLEHDKGSGAVIARQYRDLGVAMLPQKATHPPLPGKLEGSGGYGLEAGIMDMMERMQTGRLKVAAHLNDWFEEFRLYHRKDGIIVKLNDDLLSGTRYGIMMLRKARLKTIRETVPTMPAYRLTDPSMGVLG